MAYNLSIEEFEKLKSERRIAISLLKLILMESFTDNEFDEDVYKFLRDINEVPEHYKPYFLK